MDQARAKARDEAEAAADQRVAAALALERAELVKQARSLLCMCGNRHVRSTAVACSALLHCLCNRSASGAAAHTMRVAAWH